MVNNRKYVIYDAIYDKHAQKGKEDIEKKVGVEFFSSLRLRRENNTRS